MPTLTSADGTPISYTATGAGPTVLYIGGATMHRAIDECASGMAAAVSADHTVITYDRRGRGESGDTQPYSVQREIEDITALIAEFGDTAMVFGESSGGVLALEAIPLPCGGSHAWQCRRSPSPAVPAPSIPATPSVTSPPSSPMREPGLSTDRATSSTPLSSPRM
jgi:hypothetical protein